MSVFTTSWQYPATVPYLCCRSLRLHTLVITLSWPLNPCRSGAVPDHIWVYFRTDDHMIPNAGLGLSARFCHNHSPEIHLVGPPSIQRWEAFCVTFFINQSFNDRQRTLGEQLARSQRTRVSGTDSETDDHMTAANMTQLLVEGLVSEDATILQSVLQLSRTELVDATVAALPAAAVDSLLKQLAKRLDAHGTRGCIAVKWVRSVLKYHSSQAASLGDTLSSMYSTAATRTHSYLQVAKLRGRLQLLKQMASHQELDVDNDQLMTQQPMLTIDDASDSEDDGGSDALSDGGSDVGSAGGSDVMSDGEDGSSVPDVEENGVLSEEEENDSPSQVDSDSSIED